MQEEDREIDRGSKEHPKTWKDRAAGIYVPLTQPVQRRLLSLLTKVAGQTLGVYRGGQMGE